MRKIISQIHTSKDGIVCKDKTGKEHVVFKKQGDLDGACATYCVVTNLLILRQIKDKDTRVGNDEMPSDRATRKFIKTFMKEYGMHINGQSYYKIKRMLCNSFNKVECKHFDSKGSKSLDYIEKTIDKDKPIIISVSQKKWAHALLAVGYEKDNDIISKILCLDPSGESCRNKRWNMEIEVKNFGLDNRQPTIIYDGSYVSLDDVLILSVKP